MPKALSATVLAASVWHMGTDFPKQEAESFCSCGHCMHLEVLTGDTAAGLSYLEKTRFNSNGLWEMEVMTPDPGAFAHLAMQLSRRDLDGAPFGPSSAEAQQLPLSHAPASCELLDAWLAHVSSGCQLVQRGKDLHLLCPCFRYVPRPGQNGIMLKALMQTCDAVESLYQAPWTLSQPDANSKKCCSTCPAAEAVEVPVRPWGRSPRSSGEGGRGGPGRYHNSSCCVSSVWSW